jgi:hypothetical protein
MVNSQLKLVHLGAGRPALCCLGSRMCLFASNNDRMYIACPLHRCRWTAQSRASFRERRYNDLERIWSVSWPWGGWKRLTILLAGSTSSLARRLTLCRSRSQLPESKRCQAQRVALPSNCTRGTGTDAALGVGVRVVVAKRGVPMDLGGKAAARSSR